MQLRAKLPGELLAPTKLRDPGAGPKTEAPEPLIEQLLSVVVAALPLPVPPLGETRMLALAGEPTALPVPLRLTGVPTSGW